MPDLIPGARYNISITSAKFISVMHRDGRAADPDDDPTDHVMTFAVKDDLGVHTILVPGWAYNIKYTLAAPEQWPPQAGDIWEDGDGELYFAARLNIDGRDPADFEADASGQRVILMPQYPGPESDSMYDDCYRPANVMAAAKAPLNLKWRRNNA